MLTPKRTRKSAKKYDEKRRLEFIECPSCAVKPGSPTLCDSCLHNRDAIQFLHARLNRSRPTYNHTRSDSPLDPCPECEAQRRLNESSNRPTMGDFGMLLCVMNRIERRQELLRRSVLAASKKAKLLDEEW
jgi:hypothetical protein